MCTPSPHYCKTVAAHLSTSISLCPALIAQSPLSNCQGRAARRPKPMPKPTNAGTPSPHDCSTVAKLVSRSMKFCPALIAQSPLSRRPKQIQKPMIFCTCTKFYYRMQIVKRSNCTPLQIALTSMPSKRVRRRGRTDATAED